MMYRSFLFLLVCLSPFVSSSAWATPTLVFDINSGEVVYAEEAHRLWHPASTTKLMTAYLMFEALKHGKLTMEDKVISTETALKEPPSKIGLPVGSEISVATALKALVIKSANDVAVMIAEKLGGSVEGFASMMNAKAHELGMTRTHFVNPNGLHNVAHYTTAHDMGLLASAVIKDFPEHAKLFTLGHMMMGKRRLRSYNSLIHKKYPGATGMKTGFVCASGYNIVGSARRGNVHLVAVVFGSRNGKKRHKRIAGLLDYGFDRLAWKRTFFPGQTIKNIAVTKQELALAPANLRPTVCGRPVIKKKKKRRRNVRKKKKKRVVGAH